MFSFYLTLFSVEKIHMRLPFSTLPTILSLTLVGANKMILKHVDSFQNQTDEHVGLKHV